MPDSRGNKVRNETADIVYPIIDYILNVKGRLNRGDSLSLEEEQLILGRLLTTEPRTEQTSSVADEKVSSPSIDELRYAMVCLIDEFFISSTSWSDAWNERKFESRRYSTNDRAWKFWKSANQALSAGDVEMVEVYLVCVILGFRGQMADDRRGLEEWVRKAERFVETRRARLWSEPPSSEARTFVPPLHGRRSFESALLRLGLLFLAAVSLIVFMAVQQLGSL
jgi:type VI secretion system protein ImpK